MAVILLIFSGSDRKRSSIEGKKGDITSCFCFRNVGEGCFFIEWEIWFSSSLDSRQTLSPVPPFWLHHMKRKWKLLLPPFRPTFETWTSWQIGKNLHTDWKAKLKCPFCAIRNEVQIRTEWIRIVIWWADGRKWNITNSTGRKIIHKADQKWMGFEEEADWSSDMVHLHVSLVSIFLILRLGYSSDNLLYSFPASTSMRASRCIILSITVSRQSWLLSWLLIPNMLLLIPSFWAHVWALLWERHARFAY
jgi:hypothetical protein